MRPARRDYRGTELIGLSQRELNRIRGAKITMIFQEPMTSLDPLYPVGDQIAEPLIEHAGLSKTAARERAIELLRLVQIQQPERRVNAYPHELSGGQRQRVMIAMALANDPDILIADEPTTALDVTIQAQILALLKSLQARLGMAVDLHHPRPRHRPPLRRPRLCHARGRGRGGGAGRAHLLAARSTTTRSCCSRPSRRARRPPIPDDAPPLLEAGNIRVTFHIGGGLLQRRRLRADGRRRRLAHAARGPDDRHRRRIRLGKIDARPCAAEASSERGHDPLRGARPDGRSISGKERWVRRELQIVFQDPYGSLSPRLTVGQIVTEGLLVHEPELPRAERDRRAVQALDEVQLDPATRNRYPHEFSGGQRQRIAIARTMILKPKVVVLDEPTSALDRSVQKEIVELLRNLQQAHGLSYLFISHDLAVVRAMADEVIVMKEGRVVERGCTEEVFADPKDPYTRALMAAALLGVAPDKTVVATA